jgi:predicted permease
VLFVLTLVLPIFGLVLAGWLSRRLGVLGEHATSELNRFVVNLALPALLIDIVANARWSEIWQPDFIAAFGLGAALLFVATVAVSLRADRPLADAAVDALNAAYANTGFMGFPLAAAVFGAAALAPTLIATIITVCAVFAVALVLIEAGVQARARPLAMLGKVALSLARNPLLVSPLIGAVLLACHIKPPGPIETFIKLLGGAASPCALVALGLFLAEKREGPKPEVKAVAALVAAKLVGQPLATWALATQIFHLAPGMVRIAVLVAALPTGAGPFMVAEYYRREAGLTSRVVLASTILSVVTITLYLSATHT